MVHSLAREVGLDSGPELVPEKEKIFLQPIVEGLLNSWRRVSDRPSWILISKTPATKSKIALCFFCYTTGIVVSLEIPGIDVSLEIPGIVVSLEISGIVVSLVIPYFQPIFS